MDIQLKAHDRMMGITHIQVPLFMKMVLLSVLQQFATQLILPIQNPFLG